MPHQTFPRKTGLEDNTAMRSESTGVQAGRSNVSQGAQGETPGIFKRFSRVATSASNSVRRRHDIGPENIEVDTYDEIIEKSLKFDSDETAEWRIQRNGFAGYKIPKGWTQIRIPEANVRAVCLAQYMRNSLVVLYRETEYDSASGPRHMVVEYIKDDDYTLSFERGAKSDALSDFYDFHGLVAVTGQIVIEVKNLDGTTTKYTWPL